MFEAKRNIGVVFETEWLFWSGTRFEPKSSDMGYVKAKLLKNFLKNSNLLDAYESLYIALSHNRNNNLINADDMNITSQMLNLTLVHNIHT